MTVRPSPYFYTYLDYVPPKGRGPVVLILSGASGVETYVPFAHEVSALGYYVRLYEGHDFPAWYPAGADKLRVAITQARTSPHASPGKVAVIGLSLGGGSVIAHAGTWSDLVAVDITYYPDVQNVRSVDDAMHWLSVPTLVLSGVLDRGGGPRGSECCTIERMRAMAASARTYNTPLQLVEYPNAAHGFNLSGQRFDRADADDAWARVVAALHERLGG